LVQVRQAHLGRQTNRTGGATKWSVQLPGQTEIQACLSCCTPDDARVTRESGRARFRFSMLEDEVDGVSLRLDGKSPPDIAARVPQHPVDQRHAGADLIVPMGLYREHQQSQRIFTIVMSSIAAMSLLVGCIGIMNIMLANVFERRREIGLKRALGRRRDGQAVPGKKRDSSR
jgi:putative ABC transport system permease protein